MAENTDPATGADGKPPDGNPSSQRRIFGTKRLANPPPAPGPTPPELEAKIANLVDSVKVLQNHLAGGRPIADDAPEAEAKPRRMKRFQRSAAGGGSGDEATGGEAEPVLDHDVRGDESTLNKNIAWPRLTRPEDAPVGFTARAASYIRRHPFILWLAVQIAGLGLLAVGCWAGMSIAGEDDERPKGARSAAKTAADDSLAPAGVNDRTFQAIGNALRAERAGDLDTARLTWEEAAAGRLPAPGAEYRLAMLAIQRDDLTAADISLTKSLTAGQMMTSCYFVNAWFSGRNRNYADAARQLGRAVRIDPFSAKYLFCWGEALRRAGKTQAGIDAITQAIDRPASPADLELFEFKRRLALAESGHDDAFNAELADHLAKQPVGGDWLLLAAAQELTRAAYPAAAGHMEAAARVPTLHNYSLLVRDYIFQSYAKHPEIARLLTVPPPPASGKPFDPGAWPVEEADPAIWPPFAPAL